MNPYAQITANKTRTYLIIGLFIILMTGFFFLVGQYYQDPTTFLVIGLIVSLISSVGSYFYSDKIVLMTVAAKEAKKGDYFDLYTVTGNLALGAGMPMPKVYVINDPAPNAFATGRDPKHAVVAATTGLLERLDRAELEGVIAHELSHIKNYDMLVSTIVAVLVGTIAPVADWIMRSMWWGRDDDNRSSRNPFMFAILLVALIITPIVATLIQLAVSRRREYLADASGALLNRNPDALARALIKISNDPHVMRTATTSTAHLFISNPFKKRGNMSWLANLFSTHPPIEDRVKILRQM